MVYFIVDVWSISHGCPSFFLFLSVRHSNSGSLHGTQASEKFRRYKGVKLAALCLKERGRAQARTRRRIANFTYALISTTQAKILRTVQREQKRNIQRGPSRSLFFATFQFVPFPGGDPEKKHTVFIRISAQPRISTHLE